MHFGRYIAGRRIRFGWLTRATSFGARWELHLGDDNEFRVFYSVYPDKAEVHILAFGIKRRERLYIGRKEVKI